MAFELLYIIIVGVGNFKSIYLQTSSEMETSNSFNDTTLSEISADGNSETDVDYRGELVSDDEDARRKLKIKIKEDTDHFGKTKKNIRVRQLLSQIKKIDANNSVLMRFGKEFVKRLNSSQVTLMPTFYNYIARELSSIDASMNVSAFDVVRNKKMEELAVILNEYITQDPAGIATMAYDWLFDLKIHIITQTKNETLFDILKDTLKEAKERRNARLRSNKSKQKSRKVVSAVAIDKADEMLLQKAMNY